MASEFKDLIDVKYTRLLATSIRATHPDFDPRGLNDVERTLTSLELKERVRCIAGALQESFPQPRLGIPVLVKAAEVGDIRGFGVWPITHYIETAGLEEFELSMGALYSLTWRFTAEFAVRPFIIKYPEKSLALLSSWAEDANVHVRRLVSEGTRPRLPWGSRLAGFVQDPTPTLTLLEKLKHDPELYVRKSVANHLNDISKDHPLLVVETLKRWNDDLPEDQISNVRWLTRHALRTLIKGGHPEALRLLGVNDLEPTIEISKIELSKTELVMNEALDFTFTIRSRSHKESKLVIDYVVHHRKANGAINPKVFKLKTVTLPAGQEITLAKRHVIKPISTRRYYSGDHWLEVQVNGARYGKTKWRLRADSRESE